MDGYIGEIRLFAGAFAPYRWLPCQGQILAISLYEELFSLLGTTYGGDGDQTFGLPNLPGPLPGAPLAYVICVYGVYPARP